MIDPSVNPLEEEDSFTRVGRKGNAALNQMTHDVSKAIFGAEVPCLKMSFGWSKPVMGQNRAHHYMGVCFDHDITKEVTNPRVLELTADEEADGDVIFHAEEVDAARRDHINSCISNAQQDPGLISGTAAS